MTGGEASAAAQAASKSRSKRVPPWRNPWRRPYILGGLTWLYILWSLLPILIAVQFSFNDGRSRSTWQGFSVQWYCCNEGSVWEDPSPCSRSRTASSSGLRPSYSDPIGRDAGHGAYPVALAHQQRGECDLADPVGHT